MSKSEELEELKQIKKLLILRLYGQGLKQKVIADALGVSARTLRNWMPAMESAEHLGGYKNES